MDFDFSNTSFSFLVSIVVAILSIGYPLFLNNIQRIDEQYRSTRLARRFQIDNNFTRYRQLLVISIAISFVTPFLIFATDNARINVFIIGIQCLVVLKLVRQMLQLFSLIQKYYDITQMCLLLGICNKPDNDNGYGEDKLLCAVDIMKYASHNGNRDIFENCKKYLYRAIEKDAKGSEGDTYDMGRSVQQAFMQIAHYSKDKDNIYLHNECVIAECLYSMHPKRFNGGNNLKVLWQSLLLMMDTDSTVWFRDYWRRAVQYFTTESSKEVGEDEIKKITINIGREAFKELHWMVGAALVYYKKYEWLRFALFYSSISPVEYPLVPSSFTLIMNGMTKIRKMLDSVEGELSVGKLEWQIPCKYQIEIYHEDKEAASMMLKLASKYFALLMIRLFSVNDYDITHSDPLAAPDIPEDPGDKDYMLKVAQELDANIDFWYRDDLIYRLQLPNLPQKELAKNLLKALLKQ